jgi:uncharacterized membrane protein
METALGVLMRWIHITSIVIAVGGLIFARFALHPSLARLPEAQRQSVVDGIASRFSPWIWAALAGAVVSGLYNFLTKPSYPPGYHMWFGIKALLALHIIAVLILLARPRGSYEKRARWMSGVIASGLAVFAISAYLRWISNVPQ